MKNIYRFLFALAPSKLHIFALFFCLVISSCGLEEPYDSSADSGAIEFVARPIGYNNQEVETKSDPNDFEKEIHNCFFLLFDNATGERINTPVNLVGSEVATLPTQLVKLDKVKATSVTACFIANVPVDFVSNIEGLNRPANVADNEANNQKYLNSAVLSGITYGTGDNFGKPYIDLDGATGNNDPVACIPMHGKVALSSVPTTTQIIQVPLKRLFSKVSMNLTVDLNDLGALNYLRDSYYNINTCTINNLPKVVSLVEPSNTDTYESDWADINKTQTQHSNYFSSSAVSFDNTKVYNDDANNSSKSFSCAVYVPEYYLQPMSSQEYYALNTDDNKRPEGTYGNQMYKPMVYSPDKSPIYLSLSGVYKQISGETNLTYNIYLGEDSATNFTLKRNVHYDNKLIIRGFNEADIDHRVTVAGNLGLLDVHGEVANCYIISEPKEYSFLAYKGAHKFSDLQNIDDKYKCTKGTDVEVRFKDNSLILPPGSSLSVSDNKEKGVKEITVNVSGVGTIWSGNAIIDLVYTDEDGEKQVEWSWHLWFVPNISFGSTGLIELGYHEMPDENRSKMMDRNLGITQVTNVSTQIGAYYKYGYKEPYFDASKNAAKNEGNTSVYKPYGEGVIEDHAYTWNTTSKSVTDPCPPGYRIPVSSIWTDEYTCIDEYYDGYYWYCEDVSENEVDVYYPFTEHLDSQNQPSDKLSEDIPITYDGAPIEYSSTGSSISRLTIARRYRNITYNVPIELESGSIHLADSTLFYQAYAAKSAEWWQDAFSKYEILDLEWQKAKVEVESYYPLKYKLTYPKETDSWYTLEDIGLAEWGYYEVAQETVIEDALESHIKQSEIEYANSSTIAINYDNRYQVRCVKE